MTKGTCGNCAKEDQILNERHGISLCPSCLFINDDAVQKTDAIVNNLVKESRDRDDQIIVRQDLFNASTVSLIELMSAINNDPQYTTPEQREFALAKEVKTRVEKLNKVIFDKEEDLLKDKNERYQLVRNIQEIAAKFRTAAREELKEFDNNYKPQEFKPKKAKEQKDQKVKKAKSKVKKEHFNLAEYKLAAEKYKVNLLFVRNIAVQRGLTAEQAAKAVSEDPVMSKISPDITL